MEKSWKKWKSHGKIEIWVKSWKSHGILKLSTQGKKSEQIILNVMKEQTIVIIMLLIMSMYARNTCEHFSIGVNNLSINTS